MIQFSVFTRNGLRETIRVRMSALVAAGISGGPEYFPERIPAPARCGHAMAYSTRSGDAAATVDIFTELSRSLDNYPWFVEAHEKAEPSPAA